MTDRPTYAVLEHSRWTEDEEPRATVIVTHDGWTWTEVCTVWPDYADDIAGALQTVADMRAERAAEEMAELLAELEE
jgi:hypothetical protein